MNKTEIDSNMEKKLVIVKGKLRRRIVKMGEGKKEGQTYII